MQTLRRFFLACLLAPLALAAQQPVHHVFFRIQLAPTVTAPVSGRLMVFLQPVPTNNSNHFLFGPDLNINSFEPTSVHVAARELSSLAPGTTLEFDADTLVYPASFSTLPAGNYQLQAWVDVPHSFNYSGSDTSDWLSDVVTLNNWTPGSDEPLLTLNHHPVDNPKRKEFFDKIHASATHDVARYEEFESPALTHFWGRSTKIRAWVILPPGYSDTATQTWPTVYWNHGFGGGIDYALAEGITIHDRMAQKKMPPMIWVMLDETCPYGTHEFADSVNNGPWGTALTTEFIPWIESRYRMDAKTSGRLLNGHSSGGWASLQLQVSYPKLFGGTWPTSPDPADFTSFTDGLDIYAPDANFYHSADGKKLAAGRPAPNGDPMLQIDEFAKLSAVIGDYGDQFSSFEAVFSPRGQNGLPMPIFDRATGAVDTAVASYWRQHYDISYIVRTHWPELGPDLKGKIHFFVGTADTFWLDQPAHKFDALLKSLNADAHFTYIEGRTHFDLYKVGDDRNGLFDQIGAEMWATARGNQQWK